MFCGSAAGVYLCSRVSRSRRPPSRCVVSCVCPSDRARIFSGSWIHKKTTTTTTQQHTLAARTSRIIVVVVSLCRCRSRRRGIQSWRDARSSRAEQRVRSAFYSVVFCVCVCVSVSTPTAPKHSNTHAHKTLYK